MTAAEVDLKTLLDQDRQMVLELLDVSKKLVLELGTAHYWSTRCIEIFNQLSGIGGNISKLLTACEPYWPEGQRVFEREEALKLWKSTVGLWRALPPERTKLNEQLARRRRQRIMGQAVEDAGEFTKEVIDEGLARFREAHERLAQQFNALGALITALPAGLAPEAEQMSPKPVQEQTAASSASPGAKPQTPAVPAPPSPPKPGTVNPDELSPA
jgi:hypothetical protein